MISQDIDLVASDFNGEAWRCRSRDNLSSMDESFADCALPTPLGTPQLWGPGSIIEHDSSHRFWKVNKHGSFSTPRQGLGLRAYDQSCHH